MADSVRVGKLISRRRNRRSKEESELGLRNVSYVTCTEVEEKAVRDMAGAGLGETLNDPCFYRR